MGLPDHCPYEVENGPQGNDINYSQIGTFVDWSHDCKRMHVICTISFQALGGDEMGNQWLYPNRAANEWVSILVANEFMCGNRCVDCKNSFKCVVSYISHMVTFVIPGSEFLAQTVTSSDLNETLRMICLPRRLTMLNSPRVPSKSLSNQLIKQK